jgi:hypothetical protein
MQTTWYAVALTVGIAENSLVIYSLRVQAIAHHKRLYCCLSNLWVRQYPLIYHYQTIDKFAKLAYKAKDVEKQFSSAYFKKYNCQNYCFFRGNLVCFNYDTASMKATREGVYAVVKDFIDIGVNMNTRNNDVCN